MVKSDIVQKLCNQHPNLLKRDIQKTVDIFFNEIVNALTNGSYCEIRSFGTFKTKIRQARQARNPKTGEAIFIEKKIFPSFKMSKLLRIKINSDL